MDQFSHNFSVKQTWIWSFQSFEVGLCTPKKKKKLKKLLNVCVMYFLIYNFKLDHLRFKTQGHML